MNLATPAVLLLAVAAAVVAFRAAEAEVAGQQNLWELTHCLLPPRSSAEALNSLLYPLLAAPGVDKSQVVDPPAVLRPQ